MTDIARLITRILSLACSIVLCILGTGICYSQTTIFNTKPINRECVGLLEQESAEYHGVCEVVNVLCQAKTLDEIKDGLIVGNSRQYLSIDEYNDLKKNNPEKLEELIGDIDSWQEYLDSQNQPSRTLFGSPSGKLSFEGFYSLVVKRVSDDQYIISIIGGLGYIELIACYNHSDKLYRIAEIRLVRYGQANAIFYQFYPNGSLKRRFTVKYEFPKEVYAIERSLYSETPETDENPLINWGLKACRDFYTEPREIVGNVVKWDEDGTCLGVDEEASIEMLFNEDGLATLASDADERSVVNSANAVDRLPLFNLQTSISVPREGMDGRDRSNVQVISETYRSLGVSRDIYELFDNINSAATTADNGANTNKFDVFSWVFLGVSNEFEFASPEKLITLRLSGRYNRKQDEFDVPYVISCSLLEATIQEYGSDASFIIGFYLNGSIEGTCYGKHSRKRCATFQANLFVNDSFIKLFPPTNKAQSDSLFEDFTFAFTPLPIYKVGKEVRWDKDGNLSSYEEFDKPKLFFEGKN